MKSIYFHYQNLKKEDRENVLIHGRCWLGQDFLHAEWRIPSRSFRIHIDINGYDDTAIDFGFSIGLFSIFLSFKNRFLYNFFSKITKRKDQKYTNGRTIGISFHDNTLWISLWEDPMEWRSKDPKWWKFNIDFADLIFGKIKYKKIILHSGEGEVSMPEGTYDFKYNIEKYIWERSRWPFKKIREYVSFDFPIGVPHEGKGENSWDCGMDATFCCSVEWKGNIGKAIKDLTIDLIKTRLRYGPLVEDGYFEWRANAIKKQLLKQL